LTRRKLRGFASAVNLRRATPADAQGIAEAHAASWQAAYRGLLPDAVLDNLSVTERQAMWEARLAKGPSNLWVTGPEDQVSGFIAGGPSRDADLPPPEFSEIAALYVRAETWGTGCGYVLCQAAFADMRQAAAQTAIVWVLAGNTRARRFYERAGFAPDGGTKDITLHHVTLSELRYRRAL
jgi:ribosomal protein S18 acetylase RimI-like enzyme